MDAFEKNLLKRLASPAYAEMYVAANATAASIPSGSTYTKIIGTGLTLGDYKNTTPSVANGNITINRTGKYLVNATFSSKLGTDSVLWDTAVCINGVEKTNLHMRRKFSTKGYTFNVCISGIVSLSSGDVLDIRVKHDNASSVNITNEYSNICITYIGT